MENNYFGNFDATCYSGKSKTYWYFKDFLCWYKKLGENEVIQGPFSLDERFSGLPGWLHSATFNQSTSTYWFFKGDLCWSKDSGASDTVQGPFRTQSKFPVLKPVLPEREPNTLGLDAICHSSVTDITWFFLKDLCWSIHKSSPSIRGPYDRTIHFEGVPIELDAACFSKSSTTYWFFKGTRCWSKKSGSSNSVKGGDDGFDLGKKFNFDRTEETTGVTVTKIDAVFFYQNRYWFFGHAKDTEGSEVTKWWYKDKGATKIPVELSSEQIDQAFPGFASTIQSVDATVCIDDRLTLFKNDLCYYYDLEYKNEHLVGTVPTVPKSTLQEKYDFYEFASKQFIDRGFTFSASAPTESRIIVSAAHGGKQKLPDIYLRNKDNVNCSSFSNSTDTDTLLVAQEIVQALDFGVSYNIGRVDRDYIDYNRELSCAVATDITPNSKNNARMLLPETIYENYHQVFDEFKGDLGEYTMLFDIHGFNENKSGREGYPSIVLGTTSNYGTLDNKSFRDLVVDTINNYYKNSLSSKHITAGYAVKDDEVSTEDKYTDLLGGYTIKQYVGINEDPKKVSSESKQYAVQIEISNEIRTNASKRAEFAEMFSQHLVPKVEAELKSLIPEE